MLKRILIFFVLAILSFSATADKYGVEESSFDSKITACLDDPKCANDYHKYKQQLELEEAKRREEYEKKWQESPLEALGGVIGGLLFIAAIIGAYVFVFELFGGKKKK